MHAWSVVEQVVVLAAWIKRCENPGEGRDESQHDKEDQRRERESVPAELARDAPQPGGPNMNGLR
jgi:hypothetical protein